MKESIKSLLVDDELSVADIAKKLGMDRVEVRKEIKAMGLDWAVSSNRKLSKGHQGLTDLMKELLPNYNVINEHYVGNGLYLDIYCPSLDLAAEFHGRQHFEFVPHFHPDKAAFERGQENDERKRIKCQELGISLITFCYNEDLSREKVVDRILSAISNTDDKKQEKKITRLSSKSEFYQDAKQRNNEYRRKLYKDLKRNKKT